MILAPELDVSDWLNTATPITLSDLKGKVIVLHAFQMLCPGCVSHGIPQASSIYEHYNNSPVQVIGLHTVFEHHDVMTKTALEAFVHEYRLRFPIAIDKPGNQSPIPLTMQKYHLQGTPSLIVIDQQGYLRLNHFGQISDMQVGNIIGQLLSESQTIKTNDTDRQALTDHNGENANCDDGQCAI
jgi:peroxiredoxin